jgi:16S rRNA (uracil1498-N3)-methyltransferase
VDEIIPLVTERTVVKPDKNSYSVKIKRWQKICLEAAKQSGRQRVPEIKNILKFEEALIGAKNYDLALIPHLMGERKDLRKLSLSGVRSAIIFIGPEGDFTSEEISLALNSKFQPVSLGKNILKTDTAAIFSIGILACLLNKL